MLQSRLSPLAVLVGALTLLSACGGGGPIENNVVRPGITAIENARVLTCDTNLHGLETAVEAYTLLNSEPPSDQAVLVTEQFLREPVEGWDIVGGQIVSSDPQCGEVGQPPANASVPITAPATTIGQIVTETGPLLSADEVLASMSAEQVAAVGGDECARQMSAIIAGADRYVAEQGAEPADLDQLAAAGYLPEPITAWKVEGDSLVGVEGSGCVNPDSCIVEAQTLRVALEAYLAANPGAEPATAAELVTAGFLVSEPGGVWIVDGVVVPVIGGPCENVDLGG